MKEKEIKSTQDIREVLADEINAIRSGKSTPARGNAIANITGKMLQSVKVDIEVHRYVSSGKREVKELTTNLVKGKQLTR